MNNKLDNSSLSHRVFIDGGVSDSDSTPRKSLPNRAKEQGVTKIVTKFSTVELTLTSRQKDEFRMLANGLPTPDQEASENYFRQLCKEKKITYTDLRDYFLTVKPSEEGTPQVKNIIDFFARVVSESKPGQPVGVSTVERYLRSFPGSQG
ncbi:MAG: hypothetical protein ACXU8A_06025 [Burkholderiaceae bacterium]